MVAAATAAALLHLWCTTDARTQDAAPTMNLLRWKMRGDRFEIVGECEVVAPAKPKGSKDGFEVVLPEPSFEGVAVEYGKGQYVVCDAWRGGIV